MLRKLFAARPSSPHASTNACRPRLEALEDRLTPQASAMTPDFGSPGSSLITTPSSSTETSLFAQQTLLAFGLPPSGYALFALGGVPVGGNVGTPLQTANNASGGGFGGAGGIGGVANAGAAGGGSTNPVAQAQQMATALYQMAAAENPQAANALVIDEIFEAVDTFVDNLDKSMGIHDANLEGQITAYQNAINQNPLEQSQVGHLLGALVSDLTSNALSSGQAGGF